jgi:hypothetical protein
VGFLDKVEDIVVPHIRLDDPPTASKGFGESGRLSIADGVVRFS